MYSYISENNFGPSNPIIVPTGYRLPCERLITFATLKFEAFSAASILHDHLYKQIL